MIKIFVTNIYATDYEVSHDHPDTINPTLRQLLIVAPTNLLNKASSSIYYRLEVLTQLLSYIEFLQITHLVEFYLSNDPDQTPLGYAEFKKALKVNIKRQALADMQSIDFAMTILDLNSGCFWSEIYSKLQEWLEDE